jgi:hypothetical protein
MATGAVTTREPPHRIRLTGRLTVTNGFSAAQIGGPRWPDDFEWAKDPEFHRHPLPRPLAPGKPPRRS